MSFLDSATHLTGNPVIDHWNGSYSLPRTYWINNFLFGNIAAITIFILAQALPESEMSLQLISLVGILSALLIFAISIWCAVGVWRSAEAHPKRGGSATWAGLAKLAVIVAFLGTASEYSRLMPRIIENVQLAMGGDSLGEETEISLSGNQLSISGYLTSGSSLRVAEFLDESPNLERVVLSSAGGRMIEGNRIADLIRDHSLDTHVDGACASACTLALLAGLNRSASFGSSVGFHQPSVPSSTPEEQSEMIEDLRSDYRDAGLSFSFIRQALAADPNDMWYPSEFELFEAGVLNKMDIGRVIADQLASAQSINQNVPVVVDEYTTLLSAKAQDHVLRQTFEVKANASELDLSFFRGELRNSIQEDLCSTPLIPQLMNAGAIFEFTYLDIEGREAITLPISTC